MTQTVKIDGRAIGDGYPPYMVAELSANHNGSLERALQIIGAAHQSGADAIKLQTYTPDTITIDHDGPGFVIEGGPWDGRALYDLYREAHTPWDWHKRLFDHAGALGLTMFSSPFDASAVEFLEELDCPAYKIASFEAVDLPLIAKCAATKKPIIMSTGMASLEEIEAAVAAARNAGADELILLHCVSGYPTQPDEANLRTIPYLADHLNVPVGLSDHTLGTAVAVAAVAQGAVMIEKHVTLKRSDGGPDAAFSIEVEELAGLVEECRVGFDALGTATFERQPSEEANAAFRRSVYVVVDVKAGDTLTAENVRIIRPGFGLPPKELDALIGRKFTADVTAGTPLSWQHVA